MTTAIDLFAGLGGFTAAADSVGLRVAGDPKFYTARTKRAVNSLTVERGPKVGAE